ncbi:hypothetical protein WR25_07198 [Diploscapter pachys]|uniref:Uncharacterized protein n=1 Tax=Diploscapter pachys TaxID=2018661 RepID=A0A2A2M3D3_9BILA|nr:hypothetical protein WR25_07198 [Diploscapter pachys]
MLRLFAQQRVAVFLGNLIVIGVDFAEGEEAVAIAAVIDERRLQRRLDARHLGEIDVALELLAFGGFEIELFDPSPRAWRSGGGSVTDRAAGRARALIGGAGRTGAGLWQRCVCSPGTSGGTALPHARHAAGRGRAVSNGGKVRHASVNLVKTAPGRRENRRIADLYSRATHGCSPLVASACANRNWQELAVSAGKIVPNSGLTLPGNPLLAPCGSQRPRGDRVQNRPRGCVWLFAGPAYACRGKDAVC